jgi:hypothetical protein
MSEQKVRLDQSFNFRLRCPSVRLRIRNNIDSTLTFRGSGAVPVGSQV